MKIRSPLLFGLAGLLAAKVVGGWMSTMECRVAFYDSSVDPLHPALSQRMLYLFWHEYILGPLAFRGRCNLAMLLSRHTDAEILGRAAHHLGFECVRGSTNRGGVTALRELMQRSASMHLTITPDGPRGPRRVLAPGAIYVASKLGMPIVCIGVGYDRPWRFGSWDRFAVPRPGSRCRAVVSPAMRIPGDLDREGVEHYRQQVQRMLNRLTLEAEAWAEAGTRKMHEQPVRTGHVKRRRRDRPHAVTAGRQPATSPVGEPLEF